MDCVKGLVRYSLLVATHTPDLRLGEPQCITPSASAPHMRNCCLPTAMRLDLGVALLAVSAIFIDSYLYLICSINDSTADICTLRGATETHIGTQYNSKISTPPVSLAATIKLELGFQATVLTNPGWDPKPYLTTGPAKPLW